MRQIEAEVGVATEAHPELSMRALRSIPWRDVAHVLAVRYPRRSVLGLVLMASQAFFYNAIFFIYALMLERF